jgi:hypothetical protein
MPPTPHTARRQEGRPPVNHHAATSSRSDAGQVRVTGRDLAGLVLTAEMQAAPYDLLAVALATRPERVRALVVRWRRAGLAATGRVGPGPAWCWLTPAGMRAVGLGYKARPPGLGRLAHIRAVLAVRLALQAGQPFRDGQAWWRSERHLRSALGGRPGHVPDAEVWWPPVPASPYPDEFWAIEAELTPKGTRRTTAIMTGLLTQTAPASHGEAARYDHVVYLCSPAALPAVQRAAATLPVPLAGRLDVRDLPQGALL